MLSARQSDTALTAYGQAQTRGRLPGCQLAHTVLAHTSTPAHQHTSADPLNLTAAVGPWPLPGLGWDALYASMLSAHPHARLRILPLAVILRALYPDPQPRPSRRPSPSDLTLVLDHQPM